MDDTDGAAREMMRASPRRLPPPGPFRTLLAGQMLGQAGDGLAQIAFAQVVLFEIGEGATPGEIAGLLAATLLPFSLVGPFAGVVIDRFDRRRVMAVMSMVRVAIMAVGLVVLTSGSEPGAYASVLLLLATSRFILAAKGAALPRTVTDGALLDANATSAIAGLAAAFSGAVIGSTFVATYPAAGFVGAGLVYLGAVAAFLRLPFLGGGEAVALVRGLYRVAGELADGAKAAFTVPAVRRPLLSMFALRFLLGAGFILLVLIADSRYSLEAPGYGLALAVTGVGAFAGSFVAPRLAEASSPSALIPAAFGAAGTTAVVMGMAPDLPVLIAGLGVTGFAFQVLKVSVDTLVQRGSPDTVRGRVFSVYDMLYNVAFVGAGLALVPLWADGRETALLWWLAATAWTGALYLWWPARPARRVSAQRLSLRNDVLGPLLTGAVALFCFPEPSLWWLAPVALVPALLSITGAPDRRRALWRGWLVGTGYLIGLNYWMTPKIGPGIVLFPALLGTTFLPWAAVAFGVARRARVPVVGGAAMTAAAWVVGEGLRSWERLGGPWGLLGTTQWNARAVLPLAALGGVWLLSFVVAAVNWSAALAVRRESAARGLAAAALIVLAALGTAWLVPEPTSTRTLTVAGVQPGPRLDAEPRFESQVTLTRSIEDAELIVWGESSVGIGLDPGPETIEEIAAVSAEVGAPILVNVDARRGDGGIYKSTVLVNGSGILGTYDKMRLVPFGEYIPLRPLLGWVASVTDASEEDRKRGGRLRVIPVNDVTLGPLICYESTFPDMSRELADRGADLIVVQASNSTFQGSWVHGQHAALAAIRAVESGRSVVHATLTGASAVFDPSGRRLLSLPASRRDGYRAEVPLGTGTTPFVRFGDWVLMLSFALVGARAVRAIASTADEDDRSVSNVDHGIS